MNRNARRVLFAAACCIFYTATAGAQTQNGGRIDEGGKNDGAKSINLNSSKSNANRSTGKTGKDTTKKTVVKSKSNITNN
jgi:hypothetical protein